MNDDRPLPPSTRVIYAVFDAVCRYDKTRLLSGISVLIIAAVMASGFYVIKKEEQGVRLRFGKVVEAVVEPGVHYKLPFIEKVHIRKVKRITRTLISGESEKTHLTLLSGDTNLLEVDINLQYRIDNLMNFLFTVSDPKELMIMLTREELINIVSQNFIDLILTSNRSIIQNHLFNEITRQLESLDIGIELIALNIVDVRPIEETLAAFRDVNDAISERIQAISNANTRKEKLIARTRGQAEALILDAKAKARERTTQAQSSASAWSALLAEYRKDPAQVAITRYWQRMRTIFTEASLSAVNPGNEANIEINLVDSLAGPMPVHIPGMPSKIGHGPSGHEPLDRPLLSTVAPNIHAIEKSDEDKLLLDGQYHTPDMERDHKPLPGDRPSTKSRSLIFDTPSIFSHSDVSSGGTSSAHQETGQHAEATTGEAHEDDEASTDKSGDEAGIDKPDMKKPGKDEKQHDQ